MYSDMYPQIMPPSAVPETPAKKYSLSKCERTFSSLVRSGSAIASASGKDKNAYVPNLNAQYNQKEFIETAKNAPKKQIIEPMEPTVHKVREYTLDIKNPSTM